MVGLPVHTITVALTGRQYIITVAFCATGAIFLDSGLEECDRVLSQAFFGNDGADVLSAWTHLLPHPLQVSGCAGCMCVLVCMCVRACVCANNFIHCVCCVWFLFGTCM